MNNMKHAGTLHIFGQTDVHDGAAIVGDDIGLRLLRDAISNAIYQNGSGVASTYTNDGEGYVVTVVCRANMARVPVPYSKLPSWPKWLQRIVG